ncbi:hypothetical protein Vretimale_8427 [Volvox reticuliferus]|uniref:Secretory carrier-associated membrane protein n=1 Tax=Volvox reticuliferus TaxID=1737510 RepID=A0A8J4CH52_9CHLO|nr:hypothetical protein Vretifemale_11826 [Volvox reticuliferus]GIM03757.1 hypothetical protein Vretimale_8427 [Volvox reticuliferus]
MAMGWGAVGGGAWGQPTSKNYEEEQAEPPRPAVSSSGAYGANSFPAAGAQQPELATTSQRSQSTNYGGFGSASGAYGQAAAGSQPSFNTGPGSTTQVDNAALRRKEAELAAKEKQLKDLETKLSGQDKKNWPICYPILYHNISEEIPEKARRIVREGYVAWWGLVICLLWNWICTCSILGEKADQKVPSWFLALLYLICGVPLSWWLWYKRLYNAAKADSAFSFVWFFLWFGIHTAFCIWAAIAVPFSVNQWSFAGFVTALNALDKSNSVGIVYLVGAGFWAALATWSCWVIVDVFMFFRGKGGIKEAKEQQAKEAALAAFRQGTVNQA